jgi:hypothetical protein
MKTLAALLFSVASLAACATDADREVGTIDKDDDRVVETTIDGDLGAWLAEQIGGQRTVGALNAAVSERLGIRPDRHVEDLDNRLNQFAQAGSRMPGQLSDKIQAIGGQRPISSLDDNLQGLIPHSRSIEELSQDAQDRIEDFISDRHIGGVFDDHEWAEEIIISGLTFTLIHGVDGHELLDSVGNSLVIDASVPGALPERHR